MPFSIIVLFSDGNSSTAIQNGVRDLRRVLGGDLIGQSLLEIVRYFCIYSTHFLGILRVLVEEVEYLIVLVTMG